MSREERLEILTHKLFDNMLETIHLMVALADEINVSRWKIVMATMWTMLKMARDAARKLLPQEIVIIDADELEKQVRETK